ncbi:MAG: hypothetical protein R6U61_05785 [Thermoplasmata archaeon]
MSGRYLKARQLAKEMEKKAKKTAEEKQNAAESLEKAEEFLEESREMGSDVEHIDKTINEAKELLDERELDDCLEKVNEALDKLKVANEERVGELLEQTSKIHELIGDEERYEESKERLDKANELLGEDAYKEALDSAQEALDLANLELQEKLTQEISSVDSLLITLEDKGEDTSEVEEVIDQAKEAAEKDDFENAVTLVEGVKEKLSNEIKDYLDEKISSVQKQQEIVRNSGKDTAEVEEFISKAKTKAKNQEFDNSLDLIKQAQGELNEAMEGVVKDKYEELMEEIDRAEELNANVIPVREKINKIDDLRREEKYSEAFEKIEEGFEKVDEAKFQRVLQTIAESRENFIKAKEIGVDISEPMELLNKARDSLKEGDHKGALEWAKAGREKVSELVRDHEEIETRINRLLDTIDELSEIGIELDEAKKHISTAEGALEDKDYEKANKSLDQAEEKIDKLGYEQVMELVEDLELLLMTAEEMDTDVGGYMDKLEESIANTKSGNYAEAGRIALENSQEVEEIIGEGFESQIESILNTAEKIREEVEGEEDLSELEKIENNVEDIRKKFESGSYKEAIEQLNENAEMLKQWQVGEAEENLRRARELVNLIEEMEEDVDIEKYRGQLEEAETALEESNFSQVIKKTNETINDLNTKIRKSTEDKFASAKMEVVKAKKAGVEIEELRKKLIECKKNIRNENYLPAIKLSMKVEEESKKIREKRKTSYERISELSSKLTELKRSGFRGDLKPAKDILLKAKDSFQNRDYTQAEKLAEQADEKIGEIKNRLTFQRRFSELEKKIDVAERLGLDISDLEATLDVIRSDSKEGKVEEALDKLKETRDDIDTRMKEYVEPEINRTKDIIQSAKQIGIDVSGPENILSDAEKEWEDGEYEHALKTIDSCQQRIEEIRNKSKKAAGEVKKAKEKLEEAKDLHADVKKANEILDGAMVALKEDRYEEAIDKSSQVLKEVDKAQKERVKKLLSSFRNKIKETKKEGVNTALADNLMKRAEKAMERKKFREAINLAMQSEGELERIELQQDIAKRSINSTHEKLEKAKEKGINVGDAENLLNQAKQAYKGGFYVKAFDNAVKSGDKLNNLIRTFEESEELIARIDEFIEKTYDMDIDVEDLKEKLNESKASFNRGRYEKSYSEIKSAESEMKNLKPQIKEVLNKVRDDVENFSQKGRDVGRAYEIIKNAEATLEVGEINSVIDMIHEAKDEFGGGDYDDYTNCINETKSLIENAKKFGAQVTEVESLVEEADTLEDEDITKAKEKAHDALEKIEEALEPYSPNIEIEVDGRVSPDSWSTITITLKNEGKGVAKEPNIKVVGARTKDIELPDMLKAGENVSVDLELKPEADIVTIRGSGLRIFDKKELDCIVDIEPSEGTFEVVKAEGDEKCSICKGSIKKGLDMIKCECGKTFHKPCAERKGTCPECGTQFKEKEEKKEEKKEKKAHKRVALKI